MSRGNDKLIYTKTENYSVNKPPIVDDDLKLIKRYLTNEYLMLKLITIIINNLF